jgi:hypothetical protein
MSDHDALLVAVTRAMRREVANRQYRPGGGGKLTWWPLIAEAMTQITGRTWSTEAATCKYKRITKSLDHDQASLAKLADSVSAETYKTTVDEVLKNSVSQRNSATEAKQKTKDEPEPEPDPTDEEIEARAEVDIKIEQANALTRTYKRLYTETLKRAAFVSTAIGMLKDIVQASEPVKWAPGEIPAVHLKREQEAVLLLSDIHIGDEIHADTMGALNVYNLDVFKDKAKRLFAGIQESLEMLRERGNVSRLRILGLGDWVTGTNIFPGQAHHVEFGAMKQALAGAEHMAELYLKCLELPGIEEIDAEHVPGNHGRPGRKGADPFEDNWDCVCYEFVRLRLANQPRLAFTWHQSWWMMPRVQGWDFLCAHGDEVKGWNGIPNYGFRRWGSKWRELLDTVGKRYDYGIIGHHHTEVEEKNLIISGAWPGASFFSAKELQSGGQATQMFYSVAQDYGITWRRRLPLDPPRLAVSEETA